MDGATGANTQDANATAGSGGSVKQLSMIDFLEEERRKLWARLVQLEEQLALLSTKTTAPVAVVSDRTAILERALERHGIRIQPEDLEEAPGSGSERWGSGETWAESHDEAGAPV